MQHLNNYKVTIQRLFNLALGIAMLDGGAIIAIQIVTFLCTYFGMQVPTNATLQSMQAVGKYNVLISIISMLNLAAIIYRITGLTRGVKFSLARCYQQAFRRWPWLMLTYIIFGFALMSISLTVVKLLAAVSAAPVSNFLPAVIFILLTFIPYALLVCICVIDQEQNPVRAIITTYNYLRYKINIQLLLTVSVMYTAPYFISNLLPNPQLTPYIGLVSALWFLFCHIVTVIIYISAAEEPRKVDEDKSEKTTKVVIV